MKTIIWFIPSFLVSVGILLLSTMMSVPFQLKAFKFPDKIEHAFAYLVLVSSLLYGFHKSGMLSTRLWISLILACSFYGVLLEWIQFTFFPNRYFEWLDALANVVGVVLGSIVFRVFSNG